MEFVALEKFLLLARTKTYAADSGKMAPLLVGSRQMEFRQNNLLYRDIYFLGNGLFNGMETIYEAGRPVWSMSYFGDFSHMTEEQADTMLRFALLDLWEETRIYRKIEKDFGTFYYRCRGQGSFQELSGREEIEVDNRRVYYFYYAGGYIG